MKENVEGGNEPAGTGNSKQSSVDRQLEGGNGRWVKSWKTLVVTWHKCLNITPSAMESLEIFRR